MADTQQLVVLSFDSRLKAEEMLIASVRLQEEGKLLVRDAVFVSKDDAGKTHVTETTDPKAGRSALGGGLWGGLIGALFLVPVAGIVVGAGASALAAKIIDTGVSDGFVKELRNTVEPGTTALALLVSHVDRDAVLEELRRFEGAKLVYGSMPEEAVAAVKEAIGESTD